MDHFVHILHTHASRNCSKLATCAAVMFFPQLVNRIVPSIKRSGDTLLVLALAGVVAPAAAALPLLPLLAVGASVAIRSFERPVQACISMLIKIAAVLLTHTTTPMTMSVAAHTWSLSRPEKERRGQH